MSTVPAARAEAISIGGGPQGALLLHGFTGTPASVSGLAGAFASAGFTVEAPLLPGHGTSVQDLVCTGWDDWSAAASTAFEELSSRCEGVVVGGLSMGGTLACRLAATHAAAVNALVCVNPMIEPVADSFLDLLRGLLAEGVDSIPGFGADVSDAGATESSYGECPIEPLLSLLGGVRDLAPALGRIRCPLLLFTSPQDHVVPPSSSDFLAARVSGPVERVVLENSFHVATLDIDAPHIESRAVDFARRAVEV